MALWLVTNRHVQAVVAAIGFITLITVLLPSTSAQSEDLFTQPVDRTTISKFHEKVIHVQVNDDSYSTETSRETSVTVYMEE